MCRSANAGMPSSHRIGTITETRVVKWLESLGWQAERVRRAGLTKFGAQDPFGMDIWAKDPNGTSLFFQVKTNLKSRSSGKKQIRDAGPWPPKTAFLVLWPRCDHKLSHPTEVWEMDGKKWRKISWE